MKRHFSCDGSIALIGLIPKSMVNVGDTASAALPEDEDTILFWRCVTKDSLGAQWEEIEPWTEEKVKTYVDAADTLVIVATPSSEPPTDPQELN